MNSEQSDRQPAPKASDDQTPVEESQRRTGTADETDAKPAAVPEAGTSEQPVEGAPNQGTEKR